MQARFLSQRIATRETFMTDLALYLSVAMPPPTDSTTWSLLILATMITLVVAWCAGLIAILLWRKKKPIADGAQADAAVPLAERLRPLVAAASKGELSSDERAKLERLVIGHWREHRPDIASLPPAEAMVKLRTDADAAPLVLSLERWLHAPSSSTTPTEIEQLLAPYSGRSIA